MRSHRQNYADFDRHLHHNTGRSIINAPKGISPKGIQEIKGTPRRQPLTRRKGISPVLSGNSVEVDYAASR
jgi:hypothetical protein